MSKYPVSLCNGQNKLNGPDIYHNNKHRVYWQGLPLSWLQNKLVKLPEFGYVWAQKRLYLYLKNVVWIRLTTSLFRLQDVCCHVEQLIDNHTILTPCVLVTRLAVNCQLSKMANIVFQSNAELDWQEKWHLSKWLFRHIVFRVILFKSQQTDSELRFILLCTNSSTMVVVQFPSHRVLTEINHPSKTNSPLLSHHLQSEHAAPFLLPTPSLLFSPSSPPPSLFSSFHLWLCYQPVSDAPGFPFHSLVKDGMRDRERQERRGVERCNALSWWMQLERKCWHNGRGA